MKILHSNEFGKIRLQDIADFEEANDIKLPEAHKIFLKRSEHEEQFSFKTGNLTIKEVILCEIELPKTTL